MPWRARCRETGTAGSASGLGKRTGSNPGTAPQADSTTAIGNLSGGCSRRTLGPVPGLAGTVVLGENGMGTRELCSDCGQGKVARSLLARVPGTARITPRRTGLMIEYRVPCPLGLLRTSS